LSILKGMKPFGLTLDEIRDLMTLLTTTPDDEGAGHGSADGEVLRSALRSYLDRADTRIAQLHGHAEGRAAARSHRCAALATSHTHKAAEVPIEPWGRASPERLTSRGCNRANLPFT